MRNFLWNLVICLPWLFMAFAVGACLWLALRIEATQDANCRVLKAVIEEAYSPQPPDPKLAELLGITQEELDDLIERAKAQAELDKARVQGPLDC